MTPSSDNKNMLLAIALSAVVFMGWQYFYAGPQLEMQRKAQQAELKAKESVAIGQPSVNSVSNPVPAINAPSVIIDRAAALTNTPRIQIETPHLNGSLSLKGGVIDDLTLVNYHETIDPKSNIIVLLQPEGTADPYFASFGWLQAGSSKPVTPISSSIWKADITKLTPDQPVTLTFDNNAGLMFKQIGRAHV